MREITILIPDGWSRRALFYSVAIGVLLALVALVAPLYSAYCGRIENQALIERARAEALAAEIREPPSCQE